MTFEQFDKIIEETFAAIQLLAVGKGREYARSEDRFGNFKRLGDEMGLPPDKVLWVYLKKHLDSIINHINTKTSHSEPIEGRVDDAVLYLLLLKGLWRDMDTTVTRAELAKDHPIARWTPEQLRQTLTQEVRCVCGGRGCNSCEPQGRG